MSVFHESVPKLQTGNLGAVVPGISCDVTFYLPGMLGSARDRSSLWTSMRQGTGIPHTLRAPFSSFFLHQKCMVAEMFHKLKYKNRSTESHQRHNSPPGERKRIKCKTVMFTHYFTYN